MADNKEIVWWTVPTSTRFEYVLNWLVRPVVFRRNAVCVKTLNSLSNTERWLSYVAPLMAAVPLILLMAAPRGLGTAIAYCVFCFAALHTTYVYFRTSKARCLMACLVELGARGELPDSAYFGLK